MALAVREARADAPARAEAHLESRRERAGFSDPGPGRAAGRPRRRGRRREQEVRVEAAQIEEQKRRAAASVDRESAQASQQKLQTGLSVGATILGAVFGRKAIGVGSLGRATTAARGVGRSMKETDDIRRANETLGAIEERARALDEEIRQETRRITEQFSAANAIERVSLAPKRGQVSVQLVGLGWLPEDRG